MLIRNKAFLILALSMMIIASGFIENADAGRYRSSKSFSKSSSSVWGQRSGGGYFGSSSSKSSSSGYSKKSSTSKSSSAVKSSSGYSKSSSTTSSAAKSSSGYSKSSSSYSKTKAGAPSFNKKTRFDSKAATANSKFTSKQSLAAYKSENSKFKKDASKPSGNYKNSGVYQKAKPNDGYYDYYRNRDRYYSSRGWNTPGWAYRSSPSFGMWDAMFWWMVLDNFNRPDYANAAYHHANDPGYQEWRMEAEALAKDDAELREKLENLDKQAAGFDGPRDSGYLPKGVPAEVALSVDTMAVKGEGKPVLRWATASKSGNYQTFADMVKEVTPDINIKTVNTAGSMENLRLLVAGEVDAAMVQSDAFDIYRKKFPYSKLFSEQAEIYPEVAQMIANRKSGIDSVKDITSEHTLYVGPENSGTALTWEGFCQQDSGYRSIKIKHLPYAEALKVVNQDPKAVMMFVSGLNSDFIKSADALAAISDRIKLVPVDDWDFNDAKDSHGNKIYHFVDIQGDTYPHLQRGMLWGTHEVESLAVQAVLVVRSEWVKEHGAKAMDMLSLGILQTKPKIIRRTVGQ